MFRPLEVFIGLRYTRAKRRNHFISFISLVSILGIAVGVTALITVISVMNGFDKELKDRILGMVSHATISGVDETVRDWPVALDRAKENPHVLGAAPYVEREAMLQGSRNAGAMIRGVVPDHRAAAFPKSTERMIDGKLSDLAPGSFGIVLGKELAQMLGGLGVGDHVTVFAPEFSATPIGALPRLKRFTIVGIFEAGMQEYDSGLAVVNMQDAQTLYRLDGPTGIRLRLDDMFQAFSVGRALSDELGQMYRITDWMQGHNNFFKAVAMEKKVMFLILSLIVAVAAFNLVSTLVMLVTDKQSDIAILRTLGQTPAQRHGHVHGAGRAGRHARHRDGRLLRRAARAQCRVDREMDRAHVPRDVPVARRLLHQRAAERPALGRCRLDHRDRVRVLRVRDAVSGVARGAHRTCGGVAL